MEPFKWTLYSMRDFLLEAKANDQNCTPYVDQDDFTSVCYPGNLIWAMFYYIRYMRLSEDSEFVAAFWEYVRGSNLHSCIGHGLKRAAKNKRHHDREKRRKRLKWLTRTTQEGWTYLPKSLSIDK
jgi:hypothetical protein